MDNSEDENSDAGSDSDAEFEGYDEFQNLSNRLDDINANIEKKNILNFSCYLKLVRAGSVQILP